MTALETMLAIAIGGLWGVLVFAFILCSLGALLTGAQALYKATLFVGALTGIAVIGGYRILVSL